MAHALFATVLPAQQMQRRTQGLVRANLYLNTSGGKGAVKAVDQGIRLRLLWTRRQGQRPIASLVGQVCGK